MRMAICDCYLVHAHLCEHVAVVVAGGLVTLSLLLYMIIERACKLSSNDKQSAIQL
jgi:hypothetical protein